MNFENPQQNNRSSENPEKNLERKIEKERTVRDLSPEETQELGDLVRKLRDSRE